MVYICIHVHTHSITYMNTHTHIHVKEPMRFVPSSMFYVLSTKYYENMRQCVSKHNYRHNLKALSVTGPDWVSTMCV